MGLHRGDPYYGLGKDWVFVPANEDVIELEFIETDMKEIHQTEDELCEMANLDSLCNVSNVPSNSGGGHSYGSRVVSGTGGSNIGNPNVPTGRQTG